MPNPKHRFSKTRSKKRRTHYKIDAPTVMACSNCGEPVLYHRVCTACGHYKGKPVMEIKEKAK